jgi:hypothetical protein
VKVRYLPGGATQKWFKATDDLTGTDIYGTASDNSQEWTIRFADKEYNQFLFATNDKAWWLVSNRDQVNEGVYDGKRKVLKSHKNSNEHELHWYNRDPGTKNKEPFIFFGGQGETIYTEAGYDFPDWLTAIKEHGGVSVYVRQAPSTRDDVCMSPDAAINSKPAPLNEKSDPTVAANTDQNAGKAAAGSVGCRVFPGQEAQKAHCENRDASYC